ncbi:hypothetical protein [Xenorhabdus doucetiae]|uniref:Uncharacterized protein n=1 Tax=Xenorhabdus doucetiae TaxID=351671 RepID=A0A068QQM1_9GAMM|nr:hypothetical protein [Xenorhabdus doucetiae]TYP17226.1 hypothetical protein LY16_00108 [Xenorhabdus doucetiae]CDG17327.1 conserved protein of unknown function [Xenorhabdus doucetiae]
MAAKIEILPATNASIIKGQPFSVVVTVSGETSFSANTEIDIVSSTGVHLIKKFPGAVVRNNFIQQMVFLADDTTSDYKISFTAKTASKPNGSVDYKPVDNPDLKPDTCVLRVSSAYLYDRNPVDFSGNPPTTNNPFISASINPVIRGGSPISNYDIPLRTTGPLRIFTEDMVEIPPYEIDQENLYYYYLLNKPSTTAVNLKIYATKNISQFVSIDTIFSNIEYNQTQIIFANTSPIDISSNFEPPAIEETYSSSTLTKPDQADEFHFMVLSYEGAKSGDFIIGFVTDNDKDIYKKQLCVGQLEIEENGYYKFKASYDDMYNGDNFISYIALNQKGNPAGSKLNYINYDNGDMNGPSANDKHRTLLAPEVYDQWGRYISKHEPINIYSIGTKGLEVRLPSDPHDLEHTITSGDMITIKVYISHYVDIYPQKARPLPIVVVENHIVQSAEITNGYYKVTITPDKLMGYDSADGYDVAVFTIDYSRLAQNQKSKIFTRSFGTVAPGERGDSVE